MKNFYFFAISTLFALSASALRPIPGDTPLAKASTANMVELNSEKIQSVTPMKSKKVSTGTIQDFNGSYDWTYYDMRRDDDEDGIADEGYSSLNIILEDEETGKVIIEFSREFKVKGTVDLEAKTLSIPNYQKAGTDKDGDIYFYLKKMNNSGDVEPGMSAEVATVGRISGNHVTFPQRTVWALGDPDNEQYGWYFITYGNELEKGVTWTEIAQGTFFENITYRIVNNAVPNNNVRVTVPVEQCDDAPNIYRIVDPLKATYQRAGINSESPAMMFDATDPDNVVVGFTDSGLYSNTLGGYIYFSASYISGEDPVDEALKIKLTHEGNKYTLTCPPKSLMIMTTTTMDFYNCSSTNPTILTYELDSSSLDSVIASDEEPVEYFNLQGIRVQNPESGIFIRRQGSNVTKVIW